LIHTRISTNARRSTTGTIRLVALLATTMGLAIFAPSAARGQVTKDIRTSASPPVAPIQTFIKQQIAKLHGDEPKATHDAREALIAESVAPGASPAYLATYARELNTELVALTKDPDLRVRLNGAVAAAKVSENIAPTLAQVGPPLVPAIMAFMDDASEAVALWGIKGAKAALPRLLAQGNAQPVIAAVIASAKKHPGNTALAYETLGAPASAPAGAPALIPNLIAPMQELFAARVASYKNGIPPEAPAELTAVSMLVDSKWWGAQNKAQRLATQQSLKNLAAAAGQQVTGPNVSEDQRMQMNLIVARCGQGFQSIGITDGVPALQQMPKNIVQPPNRNPPEAISANAKQLQDIVMKARPELAAPAGGGATNGKPATSTASGG